MFEHCKALTSIPIFDISSLEMINGEHPLKGMLKNTNIKSITFKNKPNSLTITSEILCGEENKITVNFV